MLIGFHLPKKNNIDNCQKKYFPDFWFPKSAINENNNFENYKDFTPILLDYLPTANHRAIYSYLKKKGRNQTPAEQQKIVKEVFFVERTIKRYKDTFPAKVIALNEAFRKTELRDFYSFPLIKEICTWLKENTESEIIFAEHQIIRHFATRQIAFSKIVEPLIKEGLLDSIGFQFWDIGTPMNLVIFSQLIKKYKKMGAKVLITEMGVYEKDLGKQALKTRKYLKFFENHGIESIGYWWLRDGPHTAMPVARDSDKNPGLYTANWESKPILEVFAEYVGTSN
jgi:hypothetical protein